MRTGAPTLTSPALLQAHLAYARSVQGGAQSGIDECKHQFAWDRWNCPDSATQLRGLKRGRLHIVHMTHIFYCVKNDILKGRKEKMACVMRVKCVQDIQ